MILRKNISICVIIIISRMNYSHMLHHTSLYYLFDDKVCRIPISTLSFSEVVTASNRVPIK